MKKIATRLLAILFCVFVAIDVTPESYSFASRPKPRSIGRKPRYGPSFIGFGI